MTVEEERLTICLNGGGPWGFRLQGGAGTGLPLVVSKVRRKSKAYRRLHEGDRIVKVNGVPCDNLTYDQVMEIADKSGTDLTLEIDRQSPKSWNENVKPSLDIDNNVVKKEIISVNEVSKKVTEEKEGLRIQSATLLPDDKVAERCITTNFNENATEAKLERTVEPFPSFNDLKETTDVPPADISSSSKTEEVSGDDKNFVKTTVETKHEVKGDMETSYVKKEQESVSKSFGDVKNFPDITMDTIDLNNLINATQKKLDSFKNGFTHDSIFSGSSEMKKAEMVTSSTSTISDIKAFETSNKKEEMSVKKELRESSEQIHDVDSKQNEPAKKIPPPTFPKPKTRPEPSVDAFKECFKEMEMNDSNFSLPDIGFSNQSSESTTECTETPFGATIVTKKKKMFSSSSFYEEPNAIYPTIEEQVEMARMIADSLADDTNKKSKGANMFYKRVKRSSKWIHGDSEMNDGSTVGVPATPGVEPPTPDPSQVPFRPSKGPTKLKLVLDPRHSIDINALRSSGYAFSEHNVVSPDVCHDLVKDLHSPVGKGAAMFARRKNKSEEWVVDAEKVNALLREKQMQSHSTLFDQYSSFGTTVKSPWETALDPPFRLTGAVSPDQLADTVIKRADIKRGTSVTGTDGYISPPVPVTSPPVPSLTPAAARYDIYHAKAPKGWLGNTNGVASTGYTEFTPSKPAVVASNLVQDTSNRPVKTMAFQNFNAVPRLWKKPVS